MTVPARVQRWSPETIMGLLLVLVMALGASPAQAVTLSPKTSLRIINHDVSRWYAVRDVPVKRRFFSCTSTNRLRVDCRFRLTFFDHTHICGRGYVRWFEHKRPRWMAHWETRDDICGT